MDGCNAASVALALPAQPGCKGLLHANRCVGACSFLFLPTRLASSVAALLLPLWLPVSSHTHGPQPNAVPPTPLTVLDVEPTLKADKPAATMKDEGQQTS